MNLSSQPLVLPINHRRRFLSTTTHSPMFIDASPIAVSNKIRAIQARKTRLSHLPTNPDYTSVRPLNFGYNGGVSSSQTNFSVFTAERLVDRSKDTRLDRISTRQLPRPSVLSTTSTNQQSLLWPHYQSPGGGNKQLPTQSNSTTITSLAVRSTKNKSPGGKIPDLSRRRNRQPLIDRQNSLTPNESQQKSTLKTKPLQISMINSAEMTNHNNNNNHHLPTYESDDNDENIPMDEEFEQYLQSATIKCADWLNKYIFKPED